MRVNRKGRKEGRRRILRDNEGKKASIMEKGEEEGEGRIYEENDGGENEKI